jgi:AmmeMemoRadiSam system protein A
MELTETDKKTLLNHARESIDYYFETNETPNSEAPDSRFMEKAGVFITLHKNDELRGCIGNIEPLFSLWDAIAENAISAATKDIRFAPVTKEEFKQIKIEISILTPPKLCSLDEIKIGDDGVVLEYGGRKATYLPQVWKQIPNRDLFFISLCEKAGLPGDCHKSSQTKFYKYHAIAFKES